MGSFSGLGIGLSLLFGCILLGLIAELYYLLWWKKRFTDREIGGHHTNHASELSYLFCWKNAKYVNSSGGSSQELSNSGMRITPDVSNGHEQDPEIGGGTGKDLLLKGFGEEGVESELMRLHNLCGPPRFLFTIKEETREDLESDDGKSRGERSRKGSRTRSLSDLVGAIETPSFTPLASPTLKGQFLESYNHHGFNPLFESSNAADFSKLRSSPPPTFKFLRDAEEKLMKRLMEEAEKRATLKNPNSITEEKVGPFISLVGKSKDRELQPHSASSQVLPLASSPSTFRT
ncbi:hypothetical protein RJ639_044249 [Escallonia herrerae]|uniref:Uncharacterized protein n=1 Tax=Escallonia herrerae TaxID=1293975 RepID=A0AA89B2C5_9ASTE|nr:hypothetical protein RJ639_044249 [Escallonia herrerae]